MITIISGVYSIPNSKYTIDTKGNVISYHFNKINGRKRKLSFDKDGYNFLLLILNNTRITERVHRLVAKAFIFNPNNKKSTNHYCDEECLAEYYKEWYE